MDDIARESLRVFHLEKDVEFYKEWFEDLCGVMKFKAIKEERERLLEDFDEMTNDYCKLSKENCKLRKRVKFLEDMFELKSIAFDSLLKKKTKK